MNIKGLKPNPDNPRFIKKDEFENLKKSIKEFTKFLRDRPILHDEDGIVWAGNMRYKGLKALIEQELIEDDPAFYRELKGYTLEEKKQAAILDNSPRGISGGWDYDALANKWSDLPLENWGMNMTGWIEPNKSEDELWEGMPEFTGKPAFDAFKTLYVHFETEDDYIAFGKLIDQALTEKTKYIWYPHKEKEDIKSMEF